MLTSSVATASISTAVLVAAAGSFAAIVPLEATATGATAAEPALPVVEAFFRGRAGLAALLIVLLHQLFSLLLRQLNVRHRLQEVASLRESKVGLESDRGDHRRRERAHPARDGWREEEKEREGWGGGCSEDQSSHTTGKQNEK